MNDLDELRKTIDEADKELIDIFKKRMQAALNIALYKKENNLAIYDAEREKALILKNLNYLNDEKLEKYYLEFFEGVLRASKDYQKDLINK